jgi:hypothetical protein
MFLSLSFTCIKSSQETESSRGLAFEPGSKLHVENPGGREGPLGL